MTLARSLLTADSGPPIVGYVSYSPSTLSGSSNTLVIDKPPGTKSGDLLVAAIVNASGTSTWTLPTGWTENYRQGASPALVVFTKVADGSEGSSFTFTCSQNTRQNGQILLFRGGYAFDLVGTMGSTSTVTITAPEITMSAVGFALGFFCTSQNSGNPQDYSAPTGMTATGPVITNEEQTHKVFYEAVASGSTGTRTSTADFAVANRAFLIGIKKV